MEEIKAPVITRTHAPSAGASAMRNWEGERSASRQPGTKLRLQLPP